VRALRVGTKSAEKLLAEMGGRERKGARPLTGHVDAKKGKTGSSGKFIRVVGSRSPSAVGEKNGQTFPGLPWRSN